MFTRTGNVSIVDLNALSTGTYPYDLAQVQQWGIRGSIITALDISDPVEFQQSYFSDEAGFTLYYFQDQNSNEQTSVIISSREITSQAYCTAYIVNEGQYGNLSYITYDDGKKVVNYAQWASREAFEAMQRHPKAASHMKAAASLATFDPILCEVSESIGV